MSRDGVFKGANDDTILFTGLQIVIGQDLFVFSVHLAEFCVMHEAEHFEAWASKMKLETSGARVVRPREAVVRTPSQKHVHGSLGAARVDWNCEHVQLRTDSEFSSSDMGRLSFTAQQEETAHLLDGARMRPSSCGSGAGTSQLRAACEGRYGKGLSCSPKWDGTQCDPRHAFSAFALHSASSDRRHACTSGQPSVS